MAATRVTSVRPEDTAHGEPSAWEIVLQIAGALSGLAGLVYVMGATTLWLRAALVGLPADIAIEHQTRSTVIATGMRGLIPVVVTAAGWLLVFGLVVVLGSGVQRWWRSRQGDPSELSGSEPSPEPSPPATRRARLKVLGSRLWAPLRFDARKAFDERSHDLSSHALQIAVFDVAAIVIASFISWLALAIVVGGIATIGAAIRFLDRAHRSKALGYLGAAAGALAVNVGWQVRGSIWVQGVLVNPAPPGYSNKPLPYFGETSSFIYVGWPSRDKVNGWEIKELPRDKTSLTYTAYSFPYCRSHLPARPNQLVWSVLRGHSASQISTGCK